MKIIELSSYPRSGNTWMRHLFANIFRIDYYKDIPDFHIWGKETRSLIKPVRIEGQVFGFYKSHIPNLKSMSPDLILSIYRHPLDVFLSSLNYFWITKASGKFFNSIPKSVDRMLSDGDLKDYFSIFLKNSGSDYYPGMLGTLSDYFEYIAYCTATSNLFLLKYEDLYKKRCLALEILLNQSLGLNIHIPPKVFDIVDRITIGSDSTFDFYWKSRAENYRDYLTPAQVDQYKSVHAKRLQIIGF